ncbi:MAG TPA: hypothetical protein VIM27_05105 [Gaiellales bacterium]|jgi:hypothetical protein
MRNIHLAIALAGLALLGAGGILGWQAQECLAITDFQTAPHDSGLVCPCPLTVLWVDVRGTIRAARCTTGSARACAASARPRPMTRT